MCLICACHVSIVKAVAGAALLMAVAHQEMLTGACKRGAHILCCPIRERGPVWMLNCLAFMQITDKSIPFMPRTEVIDVRSGAHLGHVFNGEFHIQLQT